MSDASPVKQAVLPKLPPLPRKGNRTIYVANDELWEKAKVHAGREGLSAVIARSLADFVAQRTADEAAYEKFHFEIVPRYPDGDAVVDEVIGFEGRKLISKTFNLIDNPFEFPATARVDTVIEIYRTKLGTFVLLATPATEHPESRSTFALYERHNSIREVMSGPVANCLFPPDRHDLLTAVTTSLGKNAVTWID